MSEHAKALRALSKKLLAQAAELEVVAQQIERGDDGARDGLTEEPKEVALTDIQLRLSRHFRRRDTTPWNDKEKRAYFFATKGKTKEQFEAEMDEVLQDQLLRGEFATKSLVTLLNQWAKKLDEASLNGDEARREAPRRPMI